MSMKYLVGIYVNKDGGHEKLYDVMQDEFKSIDTKVNIGPEKCIQGKKYYFQFPIELEKDIDDNKIKNLFNRIQEEVKVKKIECQSI